MIIIVESRISDDVSAPVLCAQIHVNDEDVNRHSLSYAFDKVSQQLMDKILEAVDK